MSQRAAILRPLANCCTCSLPLRTASKARLVPAVLAAKTFSTSCERQRVTVARREMFDWINGDGRPFADPQDGPKYVGGGDQPFPMNPLFRSEPVLDEEMREHIYSRVMVEGHSMQVVSADLGVDVRRIGAVIRLLEVEKQWVAQGKPLTRQYARALTKILPQTRLTPGNQQPHEPTSELHVHSYTMQQLFVPVPESRQFSREDAAKAFHPKMRTPDVRSPQRALVRMHKAIAAGTSARKARERFEQATKVEEDRMLEHARREMDLEEARISRVDTERFQFRFKDINADNVGPTGRSRSAVGHRYGVPFDDRRGGQNLIPTSVP